MESSGCETPMQFCLRPPLRTSKTTATLLDHRFHNPMAMAETKTKDMDASEERAAGPLPTGVALHRPPRRAITASCAAVIDAFVQLKGVEAVGKWLLERLPIPLHATLPACMRYALRTYAAYGLYNVEPTLALWVEAVASAGGSLTQLRHDYRAAEDAAVAVLQGEADLLRHVSVPDWRRMDDVPGRRSLQPQPQPQPQRQGPAGNERATPAGPSKALFGNQYDAAHDGSLQLSLDVRSANFAVLQMAGVLRFCGADGVPAPTWRAFMSQFTTIPLLQTCKRLRVTVLSRIKLASGPAPKVANRLAVALLSAAVQDVLLPACPDLDLGRSLICRKHEELVFAWAPAEVATADGRQRAQRSIDAIKLAWRQAGLFAPPCGDTASASSDPAEPLFRMTTYTLRVLPWHFVAKTNLQDGASNWELKCGTREKLLPLLVHHFGAQDSPLRHFFMVNGRVARFVRDEEAEALRQIPAFQEEDSP